MFLVFRRARWQGLGGTREPLPSTFSALDLSKSISFYSMDQGTIYRDRWHLFRSTRVVWTKSDYLSCTSANYYLLSWKSGMLFEFSDALIWLSWRACFNFHIAYFGSKLTHAQFYTVWFCVTTHTLSHQIHDSSSRVRSWIVVSTLLWDQSSWSSCGRCLEWPPHTYPGSPFERSRWPCLFRSL